jgi:hypothetical protein
MKLSQCTSPICGCDGFFVSVSTHVKRVLQKREKRDESKRSCMGSKIRRTEMAPRTRTRKRRTSVRRMRRKLAMSI